MTLMAALRSVGKDLGHFGGWLEKGIEPIGQIVGALDPPLVPIIAGVEALLHVFTPKNEPGPTLTADQLQALVQAVTTIETLKMASAAKTGTVTAQVTESVSVGK